MTLVCLVLSPNSLEKEAASWKDQINFKHLKAILHSRKEAAFMHDTSPSSFFSRQSRRSSSIDEKGTGQKKRLKQWMAKKQWEHKNRASTDIKETTRTTEFDTCRAYSYSATI